MKQYRTTGNFGESSLQQHWRNKLWQIDWLNFSEFTLICQICHLFQDSCCTIWSIYCISPLSAISALDIIAIYFILIRFWKRTCNAQLVKVYIPGYKRFGNFGIGYLQLKGNKNQIKYCNKFVTDTFHQAVVP